MKMSATPTVTRMLDKIMDIHIHRYTSARERKLKSELQPLSLGATLPLTPYDLGSRSFYEMKMTTITTTPALI